MRGDIIVLGAGVIGLTTALVFRRAGFRVAVWGKEIQRNTASHAAGALWYPSALEPREQTKAWAIQTLEVFRELAGIPPSGVRFISARRYFYRPVGAPWWRDRVEFRRLSGDELPSGCRCGYDLQLPQIDMPTYLGYLRGELVAQGVPIVQRAVRTLEEALTAANGVVNCSGIGARELGKDDDLHADTGELLRIEHRLERAYLCHDSPGGPVYLVPSQDHTLALAGGDWARFAPELAGARIAERCLGDRPKRRSGVRVERELRLNGKWILHHYGHAAAGVTVSWGSAGHALGLL